VSSALNNGRSVATIISEIKDELKDFLQTRVELFQLEVREKLARFKIAAPLAAIAVLFLLTAYFLITVSLVAAVSAAFATNPYRWCFGFAIVGVAWGLLGAVVGYLAKRELELKSLKPKKTLEVLKGDQIWLQREVRNQV
jgi:uncharacterized membrane protein YqjE